MRRAAPGLPKHEKEVPGQPARAGAPLRTVTRAAPMAGGSRAVLRGEGGRETAALAAQRPVSSHSQLFQKPLPLSAQGPGGHRPEQDGPSAKAPLAARGEQGGRTARLGAGTLPGRPQTGRPGARAEGGSGAGWEDARPQRR